MGQLQDHRYKTAGDALIHQVFELDLLADEVDCGRCLLEQTRIEPQGLQ